MNPQEGNIISVRSFPWKSYSAADSGERDSFVLFATPQETIRGFFTTTFCRTQLSINRGCRKHQAR